MFGLLVLVQSTSQSSASRDFLTHCLQLLFQSVLSFRVRHFSGIFFHVGPVLAICSVPPEILEAILLPPS